MIINKLEEQLHDAFMEKYEMEEIINNEKLEIEEKIQNF